MIRTGLVGFGLAGSSFHAPLVSATDGFALAGVATSQPGKRVTARFPNCRVFATPEAMIADPNIDLVIIATPNHSHAPLARAALEGGRHVVVDKPFVIDPVDGEALTALAHAQGLVLSVFHNRRWDGDFLTVRRLLDEGSLGEIRTVEMHWDRMRPEIRSGWRERPGEGAGILADLGPHLVDQAIVLFGMPDRVGADIAIQRMQARVDDYFVLTLHYPELRVILSASTLIAAPRPRFALHGSGGSFVMHGIDPQEAVLRAGGHPGQPGFGEEGETGYGVFTGRDALSWRVKSERGDWTRFYDGLAAAIAQGAPPPVSPADALAGLRILALARRSAAEGRVLELTG